MRKLLILPSVVLSAAMLFAVPAFAQGEPSADGDPVAGELIITTDQPYRWNDNDTVLIADFHRLEVIPDPADDFIVVADLRLPTLGDLSKERWNQVHRRYDSGKGRREKIRA